MLYIKFNEDNRVQYKTQSKEQADFYGLEEYDGELEVAYDGFEYKKGYAPQKSELVILEEQLNKLEQDYNMPRVLREGILTYPKLYSEFNVKRAKELEDLAKKIRGLKEGKLNG